MAGASRTCPAGWRRSSRSPARRRGRAWPPPTATIPGVEDASSTGGEAIAPVPLRYRIPNALTLARLLVLPVFWVVLWNAENGHSVLAFVLFGLASITDYLDGYLARRFDHSTRFGRLVDPLADRLLIDSAVLILWWHGRLGWLAPVLIIGRDIALLLGLKAAARRGYELSVIYLGKTATALLMLGLGLIMLVGSDYRWPEYVFDVGLFLALVAGAIYLVTVRGRLRVERRRGLGEV
jgi:CDP-diacylglycerol---glycerol-3-phosphate 3-phosphatidyltransferase